ncbi:NAD(P)-binding domain-containing protein [Nocardia ninae]|uniref:6-phosphogluconate dehydrogenase n=1 Tax=Nocardia ninae NBRC 108245 TaxID=1210091 RepID=A0A511MET8_9NOCA|nr:NAD(P)-binding domain-containing protein [Nocardia ninae]GEM39162.1 6-phosphogluconate dehydrogenase [Nocardia ninae NBRC 108245]
MTAPQSTSSVTVVGLGPMGIALAETLLQQGHSLTVWNRTPGKADGLIARGVHRAGSITEAISASAVTLLCLKDYDTVYDIFDAADDALRGSVLVNLNSGTPSEAHAAAEWAAKAGADYLDGAIMVPPFLVGNPESVFLYSGSREVFDKHHATLATLGNPRYLGADTGLAVLYNTALLDLMYATINGFLHAAALVGSANVAAETFAELALDWFLPFVVTPYLVQQAPNLDKANYPGDFGTMEMNLNGLEHIIRTSVEQGIQPDLPQLMRAFGERASAEGYRTNNYLSVFEVFKRSTSA